MIYLNYETFKESPEYVHLIVLCTEALEGTKIARRVDMITGEKILEEQIEPYFAPSEQLKDFDGKMRTLPKIVDAELEVPQDLYDEYYDNQMEDYWSMNDYYSEEGINSEEEFAEIYGVLPKSDFDQRFNQIMRPVLEEIRDTVDNEFYERS